MQLWGVGLDFEVPFWNNWLRNDLDSQGVIVREWCELRASLGDTKLKADSYAKAPSGEVQLVTT
jgi:hypothetical protein